MLIEKLIMKTWRFFFRLLACFVFVGITPLSAQWIKTNGPDSVLALTIGRVQAANGLVVYAGTRNGLYLSLDSGASWTSNNVFTHMVVQALALTDPSHPGIVFAGTQGSGVFRSTNNGANWTAVNNGLTGLNVRALALSGTYLFAGTADGVYRSSDSGANWIPINTGLTSFNTRALENSSGGLFAGTDSGVFQATNGDTGWGVYNNGLTNFDVRAIGSVNSYLFCLGTGTGIFCWDVSSSSPSWKPINSLPNMVINALDGVRGVPDAIPDGILAGTADSGILLITGSGGGASWSSVNNGLTELDVRAIAADDMGFFDYLFLGTDGGVWRRPGLQIIPSSIKPSNVSPRGLSIDPSGHFISFNLPSAAHIMLTAFTLSGEKAAMLLDERLPAGIHERFIPAATLPKGLYIYRVQAGAISETQKILLSR